VRDANISIHYLYWIFMIMIIIATLSILVGHQYFDIPIDDMIVVVGVGVVVVGVVGGGVGGGGGVGVLFIRLINELNQKAIAKPKSHRVYRL
ncbi:MAG: hypothetical protein Q9M36_01930, partial [Sulfurovum sp.]|nr:hypothetical protein [Sulfurovum sp.]